jgi:hypothetical protein
MEKKNQESWHVEKSINLGSLVSLLAVVAALFTYMSRLEGRISILEVKFETKSRQNQQRDQQSKDLGVEIKADLKELRTKIDTAMERQNKSR